MTVGHSARRWLATTAVAVGVLATAGCLGGGSNGGSSGSIGGSTDIGAVSVPEPATVALFGGGLGFAAWRRRQRRKQRRG